MKEIHFYTYPVNRKLKYDNYFDTRRAIDKRVDFIETNQISFLRMGGDYLEEGYHLFIHEDDYYFFELKLGDNEPLTQKWIRPAHNLLKLYEAGEFS